MSSFGKYFLLLAQLFKKLIKQGQLNFNPQCNIEIKKKIVPFLELGAQQLNLDTLRFRSLTGTDRRVSMT